MAISVYEAQQAGLIILGRDIGELRYYCIDEVNSFILRDGEGIKSFLSRVVKKIDNSKGYDEFYKNYMSSLPKDKLFSERFDSLLWGADLKLLLIQNSLKTTWLFRKSYIEKLLAKGGEVTILAFNDGDGYKENLEKLGVEVFAINSSNFLIRVFI